MGLGFIEDELEPFLAKGLNHLDECIRRERVMLGRDAKALLRRFTQHEAVFQKVHLLYHLPGVSEELHTFFRQGDAAAASGEYLEPDFLLRRLQRRRQTRLGNMKLFRRLGDGTDLSHSDDVFQNRMVIIPPSQIHKS